MPTIHHTCSAVMSPRTFAFRLRSRPSDAEPASASLQLERQDETGAWEALIPSLSTPGFRLYLVSMLVCLHYHLVAEARERGLSLGVVEGSFRATATADWALTELRGDFQLQLEHAAESIGAAAANPSEATGDAELIDAIRERMLHCPVFRNLDSAVPRTLQLQLIA
jgi:hypothetical protein